MSIDLRFVLDWKEYYAAQRFLRRRRGEVPAEYPLAAALAAAAAVLWAAGAAAGFVPAAVAGAVAALVLGPVLRRQGVRRRWRREPIYRTEHVVSAGERGLDYLMGRVESHLGWSYYERWLESPAAFLLVSGEDSFSLLPKRAFAGGGMIDDFRALAARNLRSGI